MYYSSLASLSLVICFIINNKLFRTGYSRELPKAKLEYRHFLHSLILFMVTDIAWGLLYEMHIIPLVYLDTIAYFASQALAVLFWTRFVVAYLDRNSFTDRILLDVGKVTFIFVVSCLVINIFTPIVFSFDENGIFLPLPIRYLFLIIQDVFFTVVALYTFRAYIKEAKNKRHQYRTIAVSGAVMAVFMTFQTFNPLLPFCVTGFLISTCLIHAFVAEEEAAEKAILLDGALKEAEKANAAKTVFLTNMSHEIRTPINVIMGMNEIIRQSSNDDKILSCTDNIRKSGTSLLSIIRDILDFTKIETGRMELVCEEYYLPDVIGDIYNLIRFRAEEKGLELRFEIDAKMPVRMKGDALRIKQVITNLLTNAVKYTEKGSVTFKATVLEKKENIAAIRVSVIDTGIGIKDEDKEKLLAPFERLDTNRTRTIAGTGVGLSITSALLRMMGSQLSVDSIYNAGSNFHFDVSQEIVENTPIGENWMDALTSYKYTDKAERRNFTSPDSHILIVDDTALNLQVICGILEPTGIQIDTAESGAEGIDKFAAGSYDLVLLDYLMPHMNGIETLAKIKEEYPEKAATTPIISITANAVAGDRERMLEAGFTNYLSKPVVIGELMDMLIQYLPDEKVHLAAEAPTEEIKEANEADELEGIPAKLLDIPWIDVKQGVEYCGTAETYMMALSMFTDHIDEKADLLEDCLTNDDLEMFIVTVHALKGSSLTLGMADFSAKSKELEFAGKRNDIEFIKEKIADYLDEFRGLKPVLQECSQ
ncbi:response regulator [Butyrivibrio sp. INlla16]|uniref:response regulator n=1 Tax=Butyrivibrio sp. INlla16 TaxID=1520807 RepID=UPI000883C188|nr:response regulator [Butyrivibrio sp. INlla16]SDB06502.1 Signal transduction histidine kinase [Butyrivibrio sp. INlla16]